MVADGDTNSIIPRVELLHLVNLSHNTIADEIYEYKNLGVLKNYVGSFSSNVEDNIDKTRKKAGLIFASNFDSRKVNPLIYVKLWKQVCLPSLFFGTEL